MTGKMFRFETGKVTREQCRTVKGNLDLAKLNQQFVEFGKFLLPGDLFGKLNQVLGEGNQLGFQRWMQVRRGLRIPPGEAQRFGGGVEQLEREAVLIGLFQCLIQGVAGFRVNFVNRCILA